MIKTVIVEDEKPNQEVLVNYLKEYCPQVNVVAIAESIETAKSAIEAFEPDLVFLDIRLKENKTSFDLINEIDPVNFQIIFVTAYDEYSIRAINETQATYYITKPIVIAELEKAVYKVEERMKAKSGTSDKQFEKLYRFLNSNKKIQIPVKDGIELVKSEEIIYCKAFGNYVQVFLKENRKATIYQSLSNFETQLASYNFKRVHRSFIINMDHVKTYKSNNKNGKILMSDGSTIILSAGYKKDFLSTL